MNTTDVKQARVGRTRRRYSDEFKSQVIEACRQPGVSMASVALANGLNANLLRRWVVESDSPIREPVLRDTSEPIPQREVHVPAAFVQLPVARDPVPSSDIRIEIWNGNNTVAVTWPASEAPSCAAWLVEWLK